MKMNRPRMGRIPANDLHYCVVFLLLRLPSGIIIELWFLVYIVYIACLVVVWRVLTALVRKLLLQHFYLQSLATLYYICTSLLLFCLLLFLSLCGSVPPYLYCIIPCIWGVWIAFHPRY